MSRAFLFIVVFGSFFVLFVYGVYLMLKTRLPDAEREAQRKHEREMREREREHQILYGADEIDRELERERD